MRLQKHMIPGRCPGFIDRHINVSFELVTRRAHQTQRSRMRRVQDGASAGKDISPPPDVPPAVAAISICSSLGSDHSFRVSAVALMSVGLFCTVIPFSTLKPQAPTPAAQPTCIPPDCSSKNAPQALDHTFPEQLDYNLRKNVHMSTRSAARSVEMQPEDGVVPFHDNA